MRDNNIPKRASSPTRAASRSGDLTGWSERVESGLRVEAAMRVATRSIRRRGTRASVPMRDRHGKRFPS